MKRSLAIVACLVATGVAGATLATPATATITPDQPVLAGGDAVAPPPPDEYKPPEEEDDKSGMTCCFY